MSPKTLRSYAYALCHWLAHCEELGMDWAKVRSEDVLRYRNGLTATNQTRNYRIGRIKTFYEWCRPFGVANPFEALLRLKRFLFLPVQRSEVRLVSLADAGKFMGELSERDALIAKIIVNCGLRRSEVLSLPRSLLAERPEGRTVPFIVRGKGEKERELRMPVTLQRELAAWAAVRPASKWLFHRNGRPLCGDTIGAAFRKARRISGISVRPHLLRHVFATLLLAQMEARCKGSRGMGAALKAVQMALGHSQLTTTERYLHMLDPGMDDDCYGALVDKIAAGLTGGKP
jgi:site-specific recombinase XerD